MQCFALTSVGLSVTFCTAVTLYKALLREFRHTRPIEVHATPRDCSLLAIILYHSAVTPVQFLEAVATKESFLDESKV